jgi:hypothetical protein
MTAYRVQVSGIDVPMYDGSSYWESRREYARCVKDSVMNDWGVGLGGADVLLMADGQVLYAHQDRSPARCARRGG